MSREVNAAGIALIKKWEGFRNTVYNDASGNQTIGIGHLVLQGEDFSKGLTDEQVIALFQSDVGKAEKIITDNVDVTLNDNQFAALVSLVFNCGAAPLCGYMGDYLNDEDWPNAAKEFLAYIHVRDHEDKLVVSHGLELRRQDEIALFLTPITSS